MKNWIEIENDSRLYYRDWGTGPTILFVSSWGLCSESWCYQMYPLSEQGFRCVAFDRRGHGNSTDTGGGYDYDTLADDLHCVMEALDLNNVLLVGHSMGCGEIVRYLSRHGSKRVQGAVLIGTCTPSVHKTPTNPEGFEDHLIELNRAAMAENFPKWVDDNTDPFFAPETEPSVKGWVQQIIMKQSFQALLQCSRTITSADFTQELAGIDVPILLIHGDRDVSHPIQASAEKTVQLLPNSRLIVYPDAPHGLLFTHAERLNEDIEEFKRALLANVK